MNNDCKKYGNQRWRVTEKQLSSLRVSGLGMQAHNAQINNIEVLQDSMGNATLCQVITISPAEGTSPTVGSSFPKAAIGGIDRDTLGKSSGSPEP